MGTGVSAPAYHVQYTVQATLLYLAKKNIQYTKTKTKMYKMKEYIFEFLNC